MAKKTDHASTNGPSTALLASVGTGDEFLPGERCLQLYRIMVRARAMEERAVKMSKSGEGYFWIGGPGEEAFNAALGLQIKKGQGPDFDFLHLHYRNSGTLIAMGMSLEDGLRQMAMTATDPHSLGRNFVGHYSRREWNVIPVSSVIEIQYAMAPGTAIVQRRSGGDAITIVVGGDAGSAEGDFASCMVWSTRPGNELPVLMIVVNNGWGVSTPACSQHGEHRIADRGNAFGIPGEVVDGNDPVASWYGIQRAMRYCRQTRRPYLLEATVSRLHGHSSSSGALLVTSELDCIALFEEKMLEAGVVDREIIEATHRTADEEADQAADQVVHEKRPKPEDVYKFTYAPSDVDAVYPGDYTGLPYSDPEA